MRDRWFAVGFRFVAPLLLASGIAFPTAVRAQCASIGAGCTAPGTALPMVSCLGSPTVGNASFAIVGTGPLPSPFLASFLLVGACASPPVPVPSGGFCFGGPQCICVLPPAPGGCSFVVDLSWLSVIPPLLPATPATWPLPIPNDPALVGATVCAQAYALLPGGGFCPGSFFLAKELLVSNGLSVTIF